MDDKIRDLIARLDDLGADPVHDLLLAVQRKGDALERWKGRWEGDVGRAWAASLQPSAMLELLAFVGLRAELNAAARAAGIAQALEGPDLVAAADEASWHTFFGKDDATLRGLADAIRAAVPAPPALPAVIEAARLNR